jgi:hypothetical protein
MEKPHLGKLVHENNSDRTGIEPFQQKLADVIFYQSYGNQKIPVSLE